MHKSVGRIGLPREQCRIPGLRLVNLRKDRVMVKLKVNGMDRSFDGEPDMPLLWYLRDELQLTGTKFGCGQGLCGACTVHVNGQAQRSCQTPMQSAAGKEIVTIEGLNPQGQHLVQLAWQEVNVPQC